jgi:predicted O-linked N-acetylglucosamine transferase (SPINDLY family)
VAYLLEPLLRAHDHSQIEVFCYADVQRPDAFTYRLQRYADHWVDIHGRGMQSVSKQIREDKIDLLFDLAGHTGYNRLEVFATKPAPVQLTGLIYPNTSGLRAIDYRIVDAVTDPVDGELYCSEQLVRLPRCYVCYRPHPDAGPVMPLPACRSGILTFGSFNNLIKVTPAVVALWARVLHAVPSSQLLLKAAALVHQAPKRRILAAFASHRIDPGRVRLEAMTPCPGHFPRYGEIDIALDPSPYNGHTTSLEAMWMGVPVICLRGDRHSARVGASLLTAIGLPELIAETPEEYVNIATSLAGDLDRLATLRAEIRERMRASPLCDGAGIARVIEKVYRAAWRKWCSDDAIHSIAGAARPR